MPKRVQLIRHATAAADGFTGNQSEITADTTAKELRLHDGLTPGGIPVARKDLANVIDATVALAGKMPASAVVQLAQALLDIVTNADDITANAADIATNAGDITTNASGLATEITNRINADNLLIPLTQKNAALGVATLNASSKVVETALLADLATLATLATNATSLTGLTAAIAELNYNDITTLGTTQPSKTVTTDASGDITHVGTQLHAVGEGCVFNGDALAAINTLDDYEEGTWTPRLQDNSLSDGEGQTYTDQTADYTKIGNKVFFSCELAMNSIGTLSGDAIIVGLPFTASASIDGNVNFGHGSSLAIAVGTNVSARVVNNSTRISLYLWDAATGATTLQVSEVSTGGTFWCSGFFTV